MNGPKERSRKSQGTEWSRNGTVKEWNRTVKHKEWFEPITNGTVLKGTVIKRSSNGIFIREQSLNGLICHLTVFELFDDRSFKKTEWFEPSSGPYSD